MPKPPTTSMLVNRQQSKVNMFNYYLVFYLIYKISFVLLLYIELYVITIHHPKSFQFN